MYNNHYELRNSSETKQNFGNYGDNKMKKFNVKSTYQIKKTLKTIYVDDFQKDCESKGGFNLVMGEVKEVCGSSVVEVSYDFVDEQVSTAETSAIAQEEVKKFLETKDGGIYSTEHRKSVISQETTEINGEVEVKEIEILISHSEAENNLLEMDMNNVDEVVLQESTMRGQVQTVYTRKMCEAVMYHSENYEKTKDGSVVFKEKVA